MDRATSPRIRLVFEEARAQVLAGQAEVPEAPEAPRAEPGAAPAPAIRVEGAAAAPPPPPPAVSALALPVEPARPAAQAPAVPAYRKPWFWGVVGGILVAGAAAIVAVALLGRSSDGRLIVVPR
jgi:hypothetical protein